MPRKHSQNSISLFPFLAVLVCTMGALILLLLVTTRQIQKERTPSTEIADLDPLTAEIIEGMDAASLQLPDIAEEENFVIEPSYQDPFLVDEKAEQEAEVEKLTAELESEGDRLEELQEELRNAQQQLLEVAADSEASQQQLAMLAEQEAELKDSLKQKEQQLAVLSAELDEQSSRTEEAEEVLRARESALVSLRKIVQDAAGATGTDAALLEFTNSTGTQRAPIVINVSQDGFEFNGFNIRLSESDLKGFPANDNPLLAGISALHAHRFPDTLVSQPYVLLLLRPSGTMMFYSIQRVLGESGIHFGYELLDEDQKVAVDSATTEERAALQNAVEEAMHRRTHLYGGAAGDPTADDGQKGMRVTPDGRVVLAEETPEGHSGRFYAGDSPLPDNLRRPTFPEADPSERNEGLTDSDTNGDSLTADANKSDGRPLLDELDWKEQLDAREQEAAEHSGFDFDDLAKQSAGNSDDETPFPEIFPKATVEPAPSTTESPESLFASAFPELSKIDPAEVERLTPADILGRPAAISGNLGVNGGRDIGIPARNVDNITVPETLDGAFCGEDLAPLMLPQRNEGTQRPFESQLQEDAPVPSTKTPTVPSESVQPREPVPGVPTDVPGVPEPVEETPADNSEKDIDPQRESADTESDRTDSLERFDWPEAAAADAARETRPVESPESRNPFADLANGNPGNAGGGSGPQAPSDSMLQQLMQGQKQGVPTPKRSSNPVLRDLMKSATDDDPKFVGYHPVRIRIDAGTIAVGNQPPFSTDGMDSNQVLQATLKGLGREVAKLPDGIDSDTTPTIDYTVGEGAALAHKRLAVALKRMDVPTRTVINVRSNFAATDSLPGNSADDRSASPNSARLPAEPFDDGNVSGKPSRTTEVSEPRSQDRRLAL